MGAVVPLSLKILDKSEISSDLITVELSESNDKDKFFWCLT